MIHTRVSEQLSDDIRRLAEDLRVPASNLVRNVLEEVFTVVESVTDDMGDMFEDLMDEAEGVHDRMRNRADGHQRRRRRRPVTGRRRSTSDSDVEAELRRDESAEATDSTRAGAEPTPAEAKKPPVPEFPDVIGWQPLVLNHDRVCASCEVQLSRGARAFIGLTAQGLSETTLCRACTGVRG